MMSAAGVIFLDPITYPGGARNEDGSCVQSIQHICLLNHEESVPRIQPGSNLRTLQLLDPIQSFRHDFVKGFSKLLEIKKLGV